jgi:hypothetical protein
VVSGKTLYLSNWANLQPGAGSVGEYNATTRAAIDANFITGLNGPAGLALGVSSVPEPSTCSAIAAAAAFFVFYRRRKPR